MNALYKFFPIPSDKIGLEWTLSTIKDAYIINYGPAGTTHYAIEGLDKINGKNKASNYTTDMIQDDVIMGDTQKLKNSILEIDKIKKPKYIFVLGSSVSSVIGSDIKGVIFEIKDQVNANLICYDSGGFKGDYSKGIENILLDLVKKVTKPPKIKMEKTFNIIGSCADQYNYESDMFYICDILNKSLDINPHCIFTSNCSIDNIETASQASINIVIRDEGLKAAQFMKENYNIDYIFNNPIGYKLTFNLIEKVAEKLKLDINQSYIENNRNNYKKNIMNLNFFTRKLQNKNVVLSGNYNTIKAFENFLEEDLNLLVKSCLINHSKGNIIENSEKYIFSASEFDKKQAINLYNPNFIFGDAVLLYFDKNAKCKLQISNPNINKRIISNHMPLVGFNGANYILECILNSNN